MLALLFIIIGYLVGSINSAILVCKAMKLPDPRGEGSGNPGATNVLRISGKLPAILVLVADALKGFLPVLVAVMVGLTGFWLAVVALATVVGHIYPVYFKFKGGKGIATGFGAMLALSPIVAVVCALVWLVVVFVSRYVSLGSLVAVVLAVILILFVHTNYFLPLAVMAILIIFRHKDNISRLKAGTESKIELK